MLYTLLYIILSVYGKQIIIIIIIIIKLNYDYYYYFHYYVKSLLYHMQVSQGSSCLVKFLKS